MRDAPPDGTIVLPDAVHPEWQSQLAHGWFLRGDRPAVRSTAGRRRLSPHGALDPGTMKPAMVEGERTGAVTVLRRLERTRPGSRVIHVLPGNARQHHAKAPNPSWSGPRAAPLRTRSPVPGPWIGSRHRQREVAPPGIGRETLIAVHVGVPVLVGGPLGRPAVGGRREGGGVAVKVGAGA